MQVTGRLDTRQLAVDFQSGRSPQDYGIYFNEHSRAAIKQNYSQLKVAIGDLVDAEQPQAAMPLAIISRTGNSFLISVPNYSILNIYLFRQGHELHFSTSLNVIAQIAGTVKTNKRYEAFGLKYQFWPGEQTVYENISKISPGHQLSIESGAESLTILESTQSRPELKNIDPDDSEQVQRYIHDTLISAVDVLSRGSEPVGVMLGGFDSALIVALLAELGRTAHTVTLSYDDATYNQTNIEPLVNRFGLQHEWVNINPALIKRGLEDYKEYFDQPVTQPHYLISSLELGRVLAEKGVETALTGDGCDGIFFGYPTVLKKARLLRKLDKLPAFIKTFTQYLSSSPLLEQLIGQPSRLMRQLLEVSNRPEHLKSFLTAMAVDDLSLARALRCPCIDKSFESEQMEGLYNTSATGMNWIEATYKGKNMVGLNRAKLASIWNHSGLRKIYSPFMMPDVTALTTDIPQEYWLSDKTPSGKYLLTQMALNSKLLTKEIVYQKKMSPVTSPADHWLKNELKDDVLGLMGKTSLFKMDYCYELLCTRRLEELFKRRMTIDNYSSQALGMLLTYSRYQDVN